MQSGKKPLTIIIATESYFPTISGVAVFSRLLAYGLEKRGHAVHVICPSTRFSSFDERENGITVHRIRAIDNPFRRQVNVSLFPRARVQQLFRQIKPDVVHLQDPTSICSEVIRMCHITDTPSVITNHFAFGYVLSYLPWLKVFHGIIARMLEKYLVRWYNRCSYITFPTETIRKQFLHTHLTPPSVAISNGVNLNQFYPSYNYAEIKQKYKIPNKPLILNVGRLDQDKKTDRIVAAFAIVRQKLDCHLVICGEGNSKPDLERQVAAAGLTSNVTFTGFVNHETELPQIYQMATCFCTASTIETQGMVVLEAMASGLAVVVPKAGALPELVKEGENGYLCKPDNTTDLAEKLMHLVSNIDHAKVMGQRSLEMVEQHEISKSLDRFESIYYQILRKS